MRKAKLYKKGYWHEWFGDNGVVKLSAGVQGREDENTIAVVIFANDYSNWDDYMG